MIQSIDGVVMMKGSIDDLMMELSAIVMSMAVKDFPKEAIITAVAVGMAEADSDDLDKKLKVVVDKEIPRKKSENKADESTSDDLLKKMFGDILGEME